jgi:hypothetical protein
VIPEGFAGVIPDSVMREHRLSKGVLAANAAGIPVIGIRRIYHSAGEFINRRGWPMVIVFALLAALSNAVNEATQHVASIAAPRRTSGWRLVVYLFRNPLWLFGWAALAGAFVFQALALHNGSRRRFHLNSHTIQTLKALGSVDIPGREAEDA